jgi:ketosteroid isomerase-like protein
MHPVQAPITGAESDSGSSSPYLALVQFYRAFNGRDISLMAANWASSDNIAMDNPLGGIRRGWDAIRPVYERLFQGPAQVYVEFWDYTIHESPDMFYAVGRERGYLRAPSADLSLAFRTSRIFSKLDGQWRQVHHHGSIEDPQLLAKYQAAVLGAQPDVASP